jgi:hypothetical protein
MDSVLDVTVHLLNNVRDPVTTTENVSSQQLLSQGEELVRHATIAVGWHGVSIQSHYQMRKR